MKEIIKIGKTEVEVDNNMAWLMEYRNQFGKDILPALMPLFSSVLEALSSVIADNKDGEIDMADVAEAINGRAMDVLMPLYSAELSDFAINITWAMAKAANDEIDPPKKWIRQFETYPLDVVLPAVFNLALKGSISSKNLKRLKKITASLKTLQPSSLTISSSPDSKED